MGRNVFGVSHASWVKSLWNIDGSLRMVMNTRTHRDYISLIGETCATGRNRREKKWNEYYFMTYTYVVDALLRDVECIDKSVLDVGTSHGNWFGYLKSKGFKRIYGVELDSQRAEQARSCGYDAVYNCDAAAVPHQSESIDVAVSNDVFVHILQQEDRIAVLKEIERLLVPGGVFILNHSMAKAFKKKDFQIDDYCSFISLDLFISQIKNNTSFRILDFKPTYFHWRFSPPPLVVRVFRRFITFPFITRCLFYSDFYSCRKLSLGDSDYVYVKLQKTPQTPQR